MDTKQFIDQNKIIVICRRIYDGTLAQLAEALYSGGIRLMEVTFDQADPDCLHRTPAAIEMLCKAFPSMQVGAGTVLNPKQVEAAAQGGAQYIISPNFNADVVRRTKELGLVSIPGAMTPSEICNASDAGADFIKLFPSGYLGFKYIKDITAPLPHIRFVATGGVTEENLGEYLAAGFAGAGVSGRLTDKSLIQEGRFGEIAKRAQVFMSVAKGDAQ